MSIRSRILILTSFARQHCRFSTKRKSELSKQYFQQGNFGHCQIQPMKAKHRVFTLDIRTWYSKSTTNEVHQCGRPHFRGHCCKTSNTRLTSTTCATWAEINRSHARTKECEENSSSQPSPRIRHHSGLPIVAILTFSASTNTMEITDTDMSHDVKGKRSFATRSLKHHRLMLWTHTTRSHLKLVGGQIKDDRQR